MKKTYVAVVLNVCMIAGISTTLPAHAQQQEQGASATTQGERGAQITPEQVVERLAAKLDLTGDQKQQITPIIAERQEKMKALRSDTSLRKYQRGRKMKSVMEESDEKINKVLNEQQRKQYAELKKQMREEMKERRGQRGSTD